MRTLESLAVSRRGRRGLAGLPLSLSVHAGVAAAVLLLPLLSPPELPGAPDGSPHGPIWVPPLPPPVVRVAPMERRRPVRVARNTGSRAGGGPVTLAPRVIPASLPLPGDDPGPSVGPMRMADGSCAECDGEPGLPPGPGLPVGEPGPPSVVVSGRDVTPPRKLRHVAPTYPELPRRAGVEGLVVVECTIDPLGRIAQARVLSGNPLLESAALEAVQQWRYTPTRVGGVPVSVLLTVTVSFHLQR